MMMKMKINGTKPPMPEMHDGAGVWARMDSNMVNLGRTQPIRALPRGRATFEASVLLSTVAAELQPPGKNFQGLE